jgi:hypothetical protein
VAAPRRRSRIPRPHPIGPSPRSEFWRTQTSCRLLSSPECDFCVGASVRRAICRRRERTMTNPFSSPPEPNTEFARVVTDQRPPWPKMKWHRVPLWTWIAAGVVGVGAVGASAAPKAQEAGVGVSAEPRTASSATGPSTAAPTLPTTAATTTSPTTTASVPPTPVPTIAPTIPVTAAPTLPPTVPSTAAPTVPPTVPPTAAPTVPPTVPPTPAPTAPPTVPPAAASPASDCDPNYTPCVPIDSDVDCAGGSGNGPSYVRGPVQVIGTDIYGLDGNDNDGVGCE